MMSEIIQEYRFASRKEYANALDSVVFKDNIQSRDLGNGKKHRYFPIPLKEAFADYVFQTWNVTKENYMELGNMFACTVSIIYIPDYPGADEILCTGSAAVLKNSAKNNLEFQLPGVRSEAIGNALTSLGNVFGRNLSRKLNKDTNIEDAFSIRAIEPKKEEKATEKTKEDKPKQAIPIKDAPF